MTNMMISPSLVMYKLSLYLFCEFNCDTSRAITEGSPAVPIDKKSAYGVYEELNRACAFNWLW